MPERNVRKEAGTPNEASRTAPNEALGAAADAAASAAAAGASAAGAGVGAGAGAASGEPPGAGAGVALTERPGVALTEAQSGLYYAQRLDPLNPVFNVAHAVDLDGALDIDAFTTAANQAAAEADSLALRIVETPEGPRQHIDPTRRPQLEVIDVSHAQDPMAAARSAMFDDLHTPIDPAQGPLAASRLFVLAARRHVWYLRVHHLAIDGYGMTLLTERVAELYRAARGEGEASAPPPSFTVVVDEDANYRAAAKREKDAAYWHETFAQRPAVAPMAPLAPARAVSASRVHRVDGEVPGTVAERLRALADREQLPWPDVLTTLVALYCQRIAGTAETVIGTPYMGRFGSRAARVPAMVMNVLAVPVALDESRPLAELCRETSVSLVRARRHGRYRSEQLRRDLGLLGGERRLYGPLINVLPFDRPLRFNGVTARVEVLGTGPVDDITFTFRGDVAAAPARVESGGDGGAAPARAEAVGDGGAAPARAEAGGDGGATPAPAVSNGAGAHRDDAAPAARLTLEIEANPDLYSRDAAAAHARRLAAFLDAALAAESLADVATASPEERRHVIETCNATAHDVPDTTLTALIEATMRRTPDAPALRFEGETLTYAALDARSHALAEALRSRGAGRDDIVAIVLPRSFELLVALVAVLRAGAAYLPLDPDYPPERLARLIHAASARVVLTDDAGQARIGEAAPDAPVLTVGDWPQQPRGPLENRTAPTSAAYLLYTSGSTGEPKGVLVEHRAIVNRLEWMREHYGFTERDRILQKTPVTFDVSVWELFLPLLTGATLVVAPPGAHRDPRAMAALIRDERITTAHFVPSMLGAFLSEPSVAGLSLQRVFCSGEELGADLRDRFHKLVTAELHNLYGPTEAAVDVSWWPASRDDRSVPVPIGFPVWNTRLYVLDEQLRPLPAGVTGHLYIAGVQLARGYLGRADLTAERFVPDPFVPGERMYDTGDLAIRREDDAIVFLGRSDAQVKIRGLRIEPGEIEAAMQSSGLVQQAAVIAREDRAGDRRLVGYLVPGPDYDAERLRTHLAARLPDYMVPAAFVALDEFPITQNGKLDRRALPAPRFGTDGGQPLRTETEAQLAALFAEVLDLDATPGADGDFFTLGGDSLLAVQLMLRVEQQWGHDPGLGALFAHPTVGALAAIIDTDELTTDHGLAPLLKLASGDPLRDHDGAAPPPLFFVHPAGGISWCYRRLARELVPQRDVYGLQSPALDPGVDVPESIDALAANYIARIEAVQPEGPLHLAGWSVGGIIAHAMAVQLERRGRQVGLLAVLDAYPSDCWRAEPEPDEGAALRALLAIAGHDPDRHPELTTRDAIIDFLRRGGSALGSLPAATLDGVVRVVTDTNRLVRGHHHDRYGGALIHVRAALDHADGKLTPQHWAPYVDGIDVIDVPFVHGELPGPAATAQIAPALSARLEQSDRAHRGSR